MEGLALPIGRLFTVANLLAFGLEVSLPTLNWPRTRPVKWQAGVGLLVGVCRGRKGDTFKRHSW